MASFRVERAQHQPILVRGVEGHRLDLVVKRTKPRGAGVDEPQDLLSHFSTRAQGCPPPLGLAGDTPPGGSGLLAGALAGVVSARLSWFQAAARVDGGVAGVICGLVVVVGACAQYWWRISSRRRAASMSL